MVEASQAEWKQKEKQEEIEHNLQQEEIEYYLQAGSVVTELTHGKVLRIAWQAAKEEKEEEWETVKVEAVWPDNLFRWGIKHFPPGSGRRE